MNKLRFDEWNCIFAFCEGIINYRNLVMVNKQCNNNEILWKLYWNSLNTENVNIFDISNKELCKISCLINKSTSKNISTIQLNDHVIELITRIYDDFYVVSDISKISTYFYLVNKVKLYVTILQYIQGFKEIDYLPEIDKNSLYFNIEHKQLHINNKKFINFPKGLKNVGFVKLFFYNSGLSNIDEICNLPTLTILDLSKNNLVEIPSTISQLTNLKSLNISTNVIKFLPAEITKLTKLTDLNFNSCELTNLPKNFTNLSLLQTLDISNNQIKSVGYFLHLTNLDLEGNMLISVDKEIFNMTSLTNLNLSKNKLKKIEQTYWTKLVNLRRLELSDNQLSEFPKINTLTVLNMSNNNLHFFPKTSEQFETLEYLYLDNNKFITYPDYLFRLCNKLFCVRIQNNGTVILAESSRKYIKDHPFYGKFKNFFECLHPRGCRVIECTGTTLKYV